MVLNVINLVKEESGYEKNIEELTKNGEVEEIFSKFVSTLILFLSGYLKPAKFHVEGIIISLTQKSKPSKLLHQLDQK